jgi:hypothetical protein
VRKLLKDYRLEFITGILAMVGLFLVSQRGMVEILLKQSFLSFQNSLALMDRLLFVELPQQLRDIPLSTLVGWLLLLLVIPFAIYRVRYRFSVSEHWRASVCPKCGSEIQRVHRGFLDRLLSHTLLPSARRYRCENADCNWNGLRRRRHHDHTSPSLQDAPDHL